MTMDAVNIEDDQAGVDEVTGGSTYEELQHAPRTSDGEAQYSQLEPCSSGRDQTVQDVTAVYVNADRVRNYRQTRR